MCNLSQYRLFHLHYQLENGLDLVPYHYALADSQFLIFFDIKQTGIPKNLKNLEKVLVIQPNLHEKGNILNPHWINSSVTVHIIKSNTAIRSISNISNFFRIINVKKNA